MGLFTPITEGLAAAGKPSLFKQIRQIIEREREAQADRLTVQWLAAVIADRTDLQLDDVARILVAVAADGGPDLRTVKGIACASVILGVSGEPITPTQH